ncbi:hypothetical protein GGP80_000536 [Salinibacter ruber]|uniref:Uncharacterized protein n=1 Tax=Salinibacter ruber TaxID=146919 RepID=A0A9X2U3A0_9BACT|nr:hypothetical protein [Salinibacter ruber]MCS3859159.1 hypothetical protein [Salinibacter ruber]MCS3866039.1 hypothetical protein [Salinibacter ruber]MCS3934577.1 hypothetical protein [Salinibacter ruber]MCS4040635.1 hypothetical protein [Salinibacter ruber]
MGNRRQCSALAAVFPRGYVHARPVTRAPVFQNRVVPERDRPVQGRPPAD